KLNTPVLGIVENMATYVCSHCGHEEEVFGKGGARLAAERLEIPFLGALPLVKAVRETSDAGKPIVLVDPSSESAKAIFKIADALKVKLEESKKKSGKLAPI